MAILKPYLFSFLSSIFLLLVLIPSISCKKEEVRIGVILNKNSTVGRIAESCIKMAVSDFYAVHPHYQTRVSMVARNSQNNIAAAAAAVDLMKNEQVHAIIGPQTSAEAKFVACLGEKARIPIISFSATSPSLSLSTSKYFIRTAHSDSSQVQALAAIIKNYGWKEVITIYEDTEYGNGIIPYLNDALLEVNTKVLNTSTISPDANDIQISKKLKKLKALRTKVFIVHMTASLGSKLFSQAKKEEMMTEGFVWIVTQGLSSLLDPVDSRSMDAMEHVLGVRPYIPESKRLANFKLKWSKNNNGDKARLNLFGLWAYDTVWAMAIAVERVGKGDLVYERPSASPNSVDIASLGMSKMGPNILNELQNATTFTGLSGYFSLVKNELEPLAFEIFNLIGYKERIIGYWTRPKGLSVDLNDAVFSDDSSDKTKLKQPLWPGDQSNQPNKFRIGVPARGKDAFTEFVNIEGGEFSGFSIEVFRAVVRVLEIPFPYKFISYTPNGSYNDLLHEIKNGMFDAVVGDTTIVANRSTYVDFTLPYSESGVSMVVLLKDNGCENMWIFLKPLSWKLWLTTGISLIFTGIVVWVLEHRINIEFRGPPGQQVGTILWFTFSTIAFAHREKVVNNLTRFVLIIWIFVALILTQSYTASLSSMLTVQRLNPTFEDLYEIKSRDCYVGYQNISFVKDLLIKQLKFPESRLKGYNTPEEYHKALSKGEVAAVFDEIPYLKIFLSLYCSNYTMVGPTYRTDGFGFAFPRESPMVPYFSRAILNVTEDYEKITNIEKNTIFRNGNHPCDNLAKISKDNSLTVYSFGGLFIITGVTSVSALLVYIFMFVHSHWPSLNDTTTPERSLWSKIVELAKHFDKKDHASTVHPEGQTDDAMQSNSGNQNEPTEDNVDRDEDNGINLPVQGNTATHAPNAEGSIYAEARTDDAMQSNSGNQKEATEDNVVRDEDNGNHTPVQGNTTTHAPNG